MAVVAVNPDAPNRWSMLWSAGRCANRATSLPRPTADLFARGSFRRLRSAIGSCWRTPAHGFGMGSNYNSKPLAAEVLVTDGKAELIRARQTFDDLIRGERIPKCSSAVG